MICDILSAGVASAELLDDEAGLLFPEEEQAIHTAAPGRRNEFISGRLCARAAMAKLGHAPVALPRGLRREPVWPPGLVGSITHCRGYRAAAVASSELYQGLGIDAEPHEALPDGIAARIAVLEEQRWLSAHQEAGVYWDRVLFSVKESIYKAWFPVAGCWLGFRDAMVHIDHLTGSFSVTPAAGRSIIGGRLLSHMSGRFRVGNGLVMAFTCIPADAA
jgi:4'-phosphopantetheinyl transferase EntD